MCQCNAHFQSTALHTTEATALQRPLGATCHTLCGTSYSTCLAWLQMPAQTIPSSHCRALLPQHSTSAAAAQASRLCTASRGSSAFTPKINVTAVPAISQSAMAQLLQRRARRHTQNTAAPAQLLTSMRSLLCQHTPLKTLPSRTCRPHWLPMAAQQSCTLCSACTRVNSKE